MDQPHSFVDSSRLGVFILSAFAVVWVVAAVALSSVPLAITIAATVIVLVAAITVNLIAASRRFATVDEEKPAMSPRRRRTVFIASNIVQAVLFSVLISVCLALNELAYIPLIGALIVGGHLIPIGLSFGETAFIVGGALMVLTGIVGTLASSMPLTTPTFAAGVVSLTNAALLIVLAGLQIHLHSRQRSAGQAAVQAEDV